MSYLRLHTVVFLAVLASAACGGSDRPESEATSTSASTTDGRTVAMNKEAYPVFPDADAGADASVSAEQGGRGFTGEGWETNTDFDLVGDPRAVKGGVFREAMNDFPATLRL